MWDFKACTVCFSTDCKLYKIDSGQLQKEYYLVSGLEAGDSVGIPQFLCVECSAYVKRFMKFRDKCKRAHFTLKELLKSNKQISKPNLEAIDREHIDIMPNLSYLSLDKIHYETSKFKWDKHNRLNVMIDDEIPIFHCSTLALENEFEVPRKKRRLSTTSIKVETEELLNHSYEHLAIKSSEDYVEQSTSNANDDADFYFDNDNLDNDDNELDTYLPCKEERKDNNEVDGSNLEEEYASVIPISMKEARAVVEVYKMFSMGKFRCQVCDKSFYSEARYNSHIRMHDQHTSGNFICILCHMCYKTEFLLKTHMTEKHMYKYVCRKCPEVSFDRMSAKQHFIWAHLQKGSKKYANWYECRPTWLCNKGGRRVKGVATLRPVRKINKLPDDFPVYTPVSQEEQYQLIEERKKSRNYLEASYKCELCYRGYREASTYSRHMIKHDPAFSGKLQCDMCKLYFKDQRKVYKHMIITHLFKYTCQVCSYVCYNRGQAHIHYRWHKNVTYSCPHCKKEFKKASTRLTHVRIKHPSSNICNLCGHSFVSENGLYCHKKISHSKEELEASEGVEPDPTHPHYCFDCDVQFFSDHAYQTHLGSSSKHATTNTSSKPPRLTRTGERKRRGRPRNGSSDIVNNGVPTATHCEICNKFLLNDVQARKHYEAEHPGAEFLKRYMCDVCGHTTRQYANLMVHMRTHTNEKPYECPHCDRRFSMPSNRDRHLVVHTGEKRYQCQHCNRRFTQSSAVKLHIQTVHLKIPYAPWDKKNRKRRKELEGTSAPASAAPPAACLQPPHKLLLDAQGDYLNAYITYNDE
ncbi:zinc finger protein 420-like [Pectinophora gossypiella]|nr:zinc finger protein 420-like [Pectinophora gossypiella]